MQEIMVAESVVRSTIREGKFDKIQALLDVSLKRDLVPSKRKCSD